MNLLIKIKRWWNDECLIHGEKKRLLASQWGIFGENVVTGVIKACEICHGDLAPVGKAENLGYWGGTPIYEWRAIDDCYNHRTYGTVEFPMEKNK